MLPRRHRLPGTLVTRVMTKGRFWRGDGFNGKYFDTQLPFTRLVVVVPKKVDKRATRRNRLRRTIIAGLAPSVLKRTKGQDIVLFIQRNSIEDTQINDMIQWLER